MPMNTQSSTEWVRRIYNRRVVNKKDKSPHGVCSSLFSTSLSAANSYSQPFNSYNHVIRNKSKT